MPPITAVPPSRTISLVLASRVVRGTFAPPATLTDRGFALLDFDVQDDGALGRDLRNDVEPESRVDVEDGRRVVDRRLDRNLETRLDRRGLVGLGLHAGRRDDLDEAAVLGRPEGDIEVERVEDVPHGEREQRRAVRQRNSTRGGHVTRERVGRSGSR